MSYALVARSAVIHRKVAGSWRRTPWPLVVGCFPGSESGGRDEPSQKCPVCWRWIQTHKAARRQHKLSVYHRTWKYIAQGLGKEKAASRARVRFQVNWQPSKDAERSAGNFSLGFPMLYPKRIRIVMFRLSGSYCQPRNPKPFNLNPAPLPKPRAQYPLIKEYTLNNKGLHIMI